MQIEIVGTDCPVLPGVTVGVQRGSGVVEEHPADGAEIHWTVDARCTEQHDLRGAYVHGRAGDRFLYLSWAQDGAMFRRAKLMLDEIPADVLAAAERTALVARVRLTMPDGSPRCAASRPPDVEWSAAG